MNRMLFNDVRGKFEIELFPPEPEDAGSVLLTVTPSHPQPLHFSMDAEDARLLAAALLEYADMQDAEPQ